MLENYEGTAIDISEFEESFDESNETGIQPVSDPEQTEDEADETVAPTEVEDSADGNDDAADTFNIPGIGEVTAEDVMEWRNGNLRQSDYTRKTQELARQREEARDALELYNYLRANPHIVEAMKQSEQNPNTVIYQTAPTAENAMLRDLAYRQRAMETDMKVAALKDKYGDVDEVALFNKAAELKTDDLEFVYRALNYDSKQINERALIEQAKAELRAELASDKSIVTTAVTTAQKSPAQETVALSADEKRVAQAMGMTEKEYSKWMNK